ncbi:cyanophycinase [Permianibacter sp. IMCC34836]|uniref:cyanophycinase n=1 Tax=Permianibacter fluminis TaxID=2738515 RepID=UPI0015558830|nr:cyanophycinase [Permianibacter fluminis]NQD35906.1 cyanophycinase [Permianibacter fluminis]
MTCSAANAESARVLVLAGGHLSICSSMNLDACAEDQRENLARDWRQQEALFEAQYEPARLSQASAAMLALLPAARIEALQKALASLPARRLSGSELSQGLKTAGLTLSDDEWLWLQERLEVQPLMVDGKTPRRERLDVNGTDPQVRAVFERFLQASQRGQTRKPRIGVLTSAAREPLDAAAFYQQWFSLLGAEVVWVPLDAASRRLRDQAQTTDSLSTPCGALSQQRQRLFGLERFARVDEALWQRYCSNDDLLPVLETLDGLFFNGGDQSLHVRSLLRADGSDSPEMALIRQRFSRGELAIMGTSAGTAVQTGNEQKTLPMISNGRSALALQHPVVTESPRLPFCESRGDCPTASDEHLSYRPQGGLRLFPHGILDTHFSQRARQGRMLMLLADTHQTAAYGVDETTALVVTEAGNKVEFDVVGANGVWIAQSLAPSKAGKQTEIKVSAHYLHAGDRASLRGKNLTIQLGSCGRSAQYKLAALDGERLINQNGVNEAALQLQMLRTDEMTVPAEHSNWSFARGKAFALCPKTGGGWSYRDLQITTTVTGRQP